MARVVACETLSKEPFKEWFPRLPDSDARITSPEDGDYNCIAWAAEDILNRWWPRGGVYWPSGVERSCSKKAFIEAFRTEGYQPCADGDLEVGKQKIALYGLVKNGAESITHAARQLPSGRWTSKVGDLEDIEHPNPDDLVGPEYGEVVCYLSRPSEALLEVSANVVESCKAILPP